MKIDQILSARHMTHGSFQDVAETAQALKAIIHCAPAMAPHQMEALDLICTKIARICNGNSYLADHWTDIQGYAMLGAMGPQDD